MEHYSAAMWLQYITGKVGSVQVLDMEQHLTQCDECLKLYALTAENSVSEQVSPRFTHGVMARVASSGRLTLPQNSKLPSTKPFQRAGNSRQSLGNYAVAACLTLLLTAGGVFGSLADALPEMTSSEISLADNAADKVGSGWSEIIAEKTLSILDIIKPD